MDNRVQILHLEDDALDAELIQATLESAGIVCRINRVQNRDEFTQALQQGEYDLILGDYRLPAYDGVSALRLAQELRPDLPFIFVSGTLGEDAAIEGFTQGATDYVLKQKLSRLAPAVKRALHEAENRRERQRAEEALRESEERIRRITDNAKDIIYRMSIPDGRYEYVNSAVAEITGYPPDEWYAHPFLIRDIIHPDWRQYFEEQWQNLLEGKVPPAYEFQILHKSGEARWVNQRNVLIKNREGDPIALEGIGTDITELKRAEHERQAHLRFFECLDRVNRAMQGTNNLEQMMSDVLDVVLPIFDCDRAFLRYPCDPEAASWRVPMERNKPEHPGVLTLGTDVPMDPEVAETLRILLNSDGPVKFGPETEYPLPADVAERFGFKSFMSMAVYPRVDKPWQFGIHQCSYARVWTQEEERLLQEIGRRLADALSSLLMFRDLQESETKFSTAFRFSPSALSVSSAKDHVYLDVNDVFLQWTGYTRAEIVGCTSTELNLWVEPDRNREFRRLLHEHGSVYNFEYAYRRKDGEARYALASAALITLGGEPSILVQSNDITARKQAEETLHLQSTTLEAAANGIVITDRQGTILWVNPAFTRLTGYTAAEALGQNPRILKSDLQAPAFYHSLWNAILSGQVWHNDEIINRRKDGTLYTEEMTITPVRQTQGEISHFIAIKQDVTERKRAEREIKRLNRVYAVLSGINEIIVRTRDRQQMFDEACRVAVEVGHFRLAWIGRFDEAADTAQIVASHGYREGDLEQLRVSLVEGASGGSDPTAAVIREGHVFLSNDIEQDEPSAPWRAAAMRQGYRSLAALPLTVSNRLWGVIHFCAAEPAFFDEQETRLLEELAADLAYAIESLQLDEQRRHAEEAMRQAQKLESLGVLAGGIAHDFNNLLVAMLGQSSLALEQLPAGSAPRAHVEKAAGAARRAADLTRQLLAYSGRGQFQVLPINLNTLLQENLHLFEVAIPKNIRLVSDLAKSLPFIEGDVGQMQQIVMNLIINASEAIGRNLGTVRVTTDTYYITPADAPLWKYIGSPLAPGLYTTLSVQDNGSGMDAATLSKIFDPFFTTKVTGRGLGLAAVLGIVRSHKGGLRVESELGKGTTFTLYFPVSAAQPTGQTISAAGQGAALTQGLVLVIDDEEPVREAVTDILESEGLTVITAPDGRAGLALYRERQADIRLVLLDLSMPGLSGEETFHELRRVNPRISVILSSGYQQSEVTRRFVSQGAIGFLQKPYDMDTLIQEIRRYLA